VLAAAALSVTAAPVVSASPATGGNGTSAGVASGVAGAIGSAEFVWSPWGLSPERCPLLADLRPRSARWLCLESTPL